jgi:hypothetical protein
MLKDFGADPSDTAEVALQKRDAHLVRREGTVGDRFSLPDLSWRPDLVAAVLEMGSTPTP